MKSKQPVPTPASQLYTSPLFRGLRSYALANADAWYVLSAEHGLLAPDQVVAPYERTLNTMRRTDQMAWATRVMRQLLGVLPPAAHVIMLAGNNYRRDLVPALEQQGFAVSIPFDRLPLGRQLARLKAIAANEYRDD